MAIKPRRIKATVKDDYLNAYTVKNNSGGDIAAGKVLYVWQADGAFLECWLAGDGFEPGKVLLIASQLIPDGSVGVARKMYVIEGVNTSAASSVGDPVYLAASGGWALSGTQQIGQVMAKSATEGKVLLAPCCFSAPANGTVSTTTLEATTVTVKSGGALNVAGTVFADEGSSVTSVKSTGLNEVEWDDEVFRVVDSGDRTKEAYFNVGLVPTGTSVRHKLPGAAATVAGRVHSGPTVATNAASSVSEAVATSYTIPAGILEARSLIRITAVLSGVFSDTNDMTARLRVGDTTLTGTVVCQTSAIVHGVNEYTVLTAQVHVTNYVAGVGNQISFFGDYRSTSGPVASTLYAGLGAGYVFNSFTDPILVELTTQWTAANTAQAAIRQFTVEVL